MAKVGPPLDSMDLQDRDMTLLRGLLESRVMTSAQVAALYFEGRKEAAKKRLQKLKAAGLIGERSRRVYEPSILSLTPRAFTLLSERGVLADYPRLDPVARENRARVSELTLRHELEVMDVKVAFHAAIRNTPTFSIQEFSTWPLLYQFEARGNSYGGSQVIVKPDGFIRIQEKETDDEFGEHTFFLEVDRSTETLDTLVKRASSYFEYYRSGDFAVRNGARREDFEEFPFRVLMLFKTSERRNNMADRLLRNHPPIFTHCALTTFTEATSDPLASVWVRPLDYREAIKGTRFDLESISPTFGYRREIEREILVEQRIRKSQLLAD